MASKHVLLTVTSQQCTHCVNYKSNQRSKLVRLIHSLNNVQLIEVDVTEISKNRSNYHPELGNYIGWYPTFILFERSTWDDHNTHLEGVVMGGKMVDQKVTFDRSSIFKAEAQAIFNWVKEKLNEPLFTSTGFNRQYQGANSSYNSGQMYNLNPSKVFLTKGGRPITSSDYTSFGMIREYKHMKVDDRFD